VKPNARVPRRLAALAHLARVLMVAGGGLVASHAAAQEGIAEDHSGHKEMQRKSGYSIMADQYTMPRVTLLDQDGAGVALADLEESTQPVALNFIFATCTTICPVMTATFAKMRDELGPAADDLLMVSITIDPEHDTPEVLSRYAETYRAGAGWRFLTGELDQIVAVQRAFRAYSGNKMSHRPLSFFKVPGKHEWLRVDGLASGAALAQEFRQLSGG